MTDTKKTKSNDTIQYYNINAGAFIENTLGANMNEHYDAFLKHIPTGGSILDAGCGSGRDSKRFIELGYEVEAFDASEEMVRFAKTYTGLNVRQCAFSEIEYEKKFDGIWACASLLHISEDLLTEVMNLLINNLKLNGAMYMSFKYGESEYEKDGRLFNCFTKDTFTEYFKNFDTLKLETMYVSDDVREGRADEKWLSVVVRKLG